MNVLPSHSNVHYQHNALSRARILAYVLPIISILISHNLNNTSQHILSSGICNGPSNFLANAYCAIPIAITVEGANILTRNLIQFGQGLTRSHPTLLHMIKAINHGDDMKGFNKALGETFVHGATNLGRSLGTPLRNLPSIDLQ